MNKEELKSLTIEQLDRMTEEQLDIVANEVVEKLADYEIEKYSDDIKKKLKLKRESFWGNKNTWITLIVGALVMSLIQLVMGK